MGVLETRPDQPEVIEEMFERLAGDRDGHIEVAHIGEVRQAHVAGLVGLTENDFLVLTMPRTPCPDAPLQGPPDTGRQIRMPAKLTSFLEQLQSFDYLIQHADECANLMDRIAAGENSLEAIKHVRLGAVQERLRIALIGT